MNFFLWLTVTAVSAVTIDWRMWPAAAGYGVSLFVALAHLDHVLLVMGVSHLVLTVNLFLIWRPMFESFEIGSRR
jgi:hypothetical protein